MAEQMPCHGIDIEPFATLVSDQQLAAFDAQGGNHTSCTSPSSSGRRSLSCVMEDSLQLAPLLVAAAKG